MFTSHLSPLTSHLTMFADVHCHLCAELDDGPRSLDEAVEMCQMAYQSGTRAMAAAAHQNSQWPKSTRESILSTCQQLRQRLSEKKINVQLFPTGEVMINADMLDDLDQGRLVTVGDRGMYLLVELPPGVFFDLGNMFVQLRERGLRPILAHPERYPEFLFGVGEIERVVEWGGLVQVNASSVTTASPQMTKALRAWFQRGIVHLIGSDGHRATQRLPVMRDAYRQVVEWTSQPMANQIFSINGTTVFEGRPLRVPHPKPPKKRFRLF